MDTTESNSNPCFLIGDKVVEVVKSDPESPFYGCMKGRVVGKKCCASMIYQTLYEPDLQCAKNQRTCKICT
jgi:hypothetical protein